MQARGLLNYRLKYCWPKVIYCICQPNELEQEIKKKTGGAKQGAKQKSGGPMAHPGPPLNRHWRRDLRPSRLRLQKTGLETRLETETKSRDSITVAYTFSLILNMRKHLSLSCPKKHDSFACRQNDCH